MIPDAACGLGHPCLSFILANSLVLPSNTTQVFLAGYKNCYCVTKSLECLVMSVNLQTLLRWTTTEGCGVVPPAWHHPHILNDSEAPFHSNLPRSLCLDRNNSCQVRVGPLWRKPAEQPVWRKNTQRHLLEGSSIWQRSTFSGPFICCRLENTEPASTLRRRTVTCRFEESSQGAKL